MAYTVVSTSAVTMLVKVERSLNNCPENEVWFKGLKFGLCKMFRNHKTNNATFAYL